MLSPKTVTYNLAPKRIQKLVQKMLQLIFVVIPFDCCLVFRSHLNLALVTYYSPQPQEGGEDFVTQASGIPKQNSIKRLILATTGSSAKRRDVYSESTFPGFSIVSKKNQSLLELLGNQRSLPHISLGTRGLVKVQGKLNTE